MPHLKDNTIVSEFRASSDGRSGSFQRFGSCGSALLEEPALTANLAVINGLCVSKQSFIQCFHKSLIFMHFVHYKKYSYYLT